MAVKDYSTDPDANVQISGINIAEGCPPSGINNAIRQLMADVKEAQEAQETAQSAKDAAQDEAIAEALDKVGLPLGFEYVRLTGQNAPLGGVDYMGQTATRAMYADLWAWLNENKPDAIVSESEWQSLYASQNGNVAKYSTGDGSTTFRFPRVVGYLKGAESVDELGQYSAEGLPDHDHTRGTMDITGMFVLGHLAAADAWAVDGAFTKSSYVANSNRYQIGTVPMDLPRFDFVASRSWTGATSPASESNPVYGNSGHVTPETVAVVMGVIAIGSVASIGEATEEGIVAELGEHGAKLGEHGTKLIELEEGVAIAVPAGFVLPFAANFTPSGYLLCNGAAVSRTIYAALFAAIGTTYGTGDGSTTFNLPNLTDRFIQGSGTSGNVKNAGVPNIAGGFTLSHVGIYGVTGAFSYSDNSVDSKVGRDFDGYERVVSFSANKSNSIYGASTTVQPPALTMRYYIKY